MDKSSREESAACVWPLSTALLPLNGRFLSGSNGRRVLGQTALSVAAVLRNLPLEFPDGDRLQRVGITQLRAAAYGYLTFNGGFSAMNSKGRQSQPDPLLPVAKLES